ncbi:NAD(P)H-binding protein [Actinocorallia aurea]
MSTVVVFGVTGYAGGHIARELLDRGHTVVGVARDTAKAAPHERLTLRSGSLYDPAFLAETVRGADAVVVAVRAHGVHEPDLEDAVPALLKAAQTEGARLGVVGGAGSLLIREGGPRVLDTDFPEEYKPEAVAHARVLDALKAADTEVDWFYLSPAGSFGSVNPGTRMGKFRLGTDLLITDAAGRSDISGADYAIAFADEIDHPAHHRSRFTVAY